MDIDKLKKLCNEYTVEVSFNGFQGFGAVSININ